MTTPSTTTKSLELQKTVNQELRLMPDTVSSPTTLCWMLMVVSTWKTLRAHLLQQLPCVPLLRTPTVTIDMYLHRSSRSHGLCRLEQTTGVAKSDLKSPSLMVQPIPGLLVRSPRTQHTTIDFLQCCWTVHSQGNRHLGRRWCKHRCLLRYFCWRIRWTSSREQHHRNQCWSNCTKRSWNELQRL